MYIPITKHTPNNVYSLEIKSTNKNIYIPLTKHMPNNVYRLYSLEIKSTNKNIYISLTKQHAKYLSLKQKLNRLKF